MLSPVAASRISIVPARVAAAIRSPSGLKAMLKTDESSLHPTPGLPPAASQILTVASSLAEAILRAVRTVHVTLVTLSS